MSQIFEALQQSKGFKSGSGLPALDFSGTTPAIMQDASEITSLQEVPAVIIAATPEKRLLSLSENREFGSEKMRMLTARLKQAQQRRPLKRILISSSIKDEGKSLVSTNLAVGMAKTQQKVLLIDGDCHQPRIADLFGVDGSAGLSKWWRTEEPILKYLRRAEGLPLWFLTAGSPLARSVEMLQSERMAQLLDEVSNWFDWVIIDSPPLAPMADSGIWANLVDGMILIVRRGVTPKRVLAKVLDSIERPKLLGLVFNDAADQELRYYSAYYAQP